MRFSDQIDLGNGALQRWQAESERLLFDHSSRSLGGVGGGHGDGVALCCDSSPFPPKPALNH